VSGAKKRLRRALVPVALGLAVSLALLGVVEVGVRLAYGAPPAHRLPDNFKYAYLDVLKPFFRRSRTGWGSARMIPQRAESLAPSFSTPKAPGTLRIFVVGGSVATPFSVDGATQLSKFASSALPNRPVEVISCGMGSYDSRRETGVLREILDYEPDLVVLLSGNNEYHLDTPYPRLLVLDHLLNGIAVYRKTTELVRSLVGKKDPDPSPAFGRANEQFERNLRGMARLCREHKIPLVLSTLGANLRDSPPSSQWRRPMLEASVFFDALQALDERRYSSAAEGLRRFTAAFPEDPYGRYYLAKAQDGQGDYREAKRNYALAADFDLPGNRTSPARNEIIRRVAREEGAILADLEKQFEALAPQGIPGAETFRDSCHWMQEFYPLVSLTILRAASERSALAPAAAWRWSWAAGLEERLRRPVIPPENRARYFEDTLLSALAAAIVIDRQLLSEESVNMLRQMLSRDAVKFERMTRTKAGLEPLFEKHWFRDYRERVDKDWPAVLVHVGEARRLEGRPDLALALFSEAAALQPDYYQARLRRAVAEANLGRRAEALRQLNALAREFPFRAEPRIWAEHFGRRP